MNPIRPCPHCGRDTDFHEDELEAVKEGDAICLACGLKMEEAHMILEMARGEHPELVQAILDREEEDEEAAEADDE